MIDNLRAKYFFYVHDSDGVFTYLSSSIKDVLGYEPTEFMKHFTTYLTNHPVNARVVEYTNLRLQGIAQPAYEVNILHKDGSTRWLEVLEVPLPGPDGDIVAIEGIACDITDRHRAEEAVRERELFLKKVIDSLDHPFIVVNVDDHRIVMANRAAGGDKLPAGCTCYFFMHGRKTPCDGDFPCLIDDIARTGKGVVRDRFHTDASNNTRHFEVHGHPIFDANGRLSQIIEYCLDITELDKLHQQLIRSESLAAAGQLAAGVAHEFNNVLAMISLSAQHGLINIERSIAGEDSSSALRQLFNGILSAANRGALIVESLLALSCPGDSHTKKPFPVGDVINRLLAMKNPEFISKNIRIEMDAQPGVMAVGNSDQMEQVFLNLIINAEHAMVPKRGGILSVRIAAHESEVEIGIRDTGVGMTEEVLTKAFLPFFTTKGAFAQDAHGIPGTGMGLPICARIMEDHDGSIRATSRVFEGAEFILRLPRSAEIVPDKAPSPSAPTPVANSVGTRLHVLVVEDDEDLADVMSGIISCDFPDTHFVTSAVAALKHVALRRPDVIITDYIMPDMRADRMLAELPAGIPVILATGWSDFSSPEERSTTFAGFYRVFKKPYRMEEIIEVLVEIADQSGK